MSANLSDRSARFFLWLALLAGLAHAPSALAAVCTTVVGATNWNVQASWGAAGTGCVGAVGGIPGAADSVTIAHNLTVSTAITVGSVTAINVGVTLQVNAVNFIVNGVTNGISGAITHPTLGGTHRYTGLVTLLAGSSWTNAGNNPVNFRGGIAHNGATFNNGTGAVTFTTAGQTISGGSAMIFGGAITITGAIVINRTNTNTITINGNLTGSVVGSTWTNAAGILDYAGAAAPMAIGALSANTAANTVIYSRVGAQNITGTTYRTLQLSGSGAKTAVTAGMTVNGDMTWVAANSATFDPSTFTHIFQGNWVVNSTAPLPLVLPVTTSLIRFAPPTAAAATSISGTTAATLTFADLDITNTSGVTFNENVTVSAGTTPTLTVAAGVTLTVGAGMTLNIGTGAVATPNATAFIAGATGTLTGAGTGTVQVTRIAATADFNTQYSVATKTLTNLTVEYVAASAQTVNALTYSNLIANNTAGLTLAGDTTVNGVLTFTLGDISTGAFTLTVGAAGSTAGTPGTTRHVVGNMAKAFSAIGSFTYTVGDGTNYAPLTAQFYTLPTPGNLTVSVTSGEHPDTTLGTTLIRSAQSVNRYWTLKASTLAGIFSAAPAYVAGDLDALATFSNFNVSRGATCTSGPRTCASWAIQSLGSPAPTAALITATAMSMTVAAAESDLVVGEPTLPRAVREKEFIFTRELY